MAGTLREFAPALWAADGPVVSFFGFAYPTRRALTTLAIGGLFVWLARSNAWSRSAGGCDRGVQ